VKYLASLKQCKLLAAFPRTFLPSMNRNEFTFFINLMPSPLTYFLALNYCYLLSKFPSFSSSLFPNLFITEV
jgi:hypothetical protein